MINYMRSYTLKTLDNKIIGRFSVFNPRINKAGKVCEQDIINQIVELGYNPLLYTWIEN